MTPKEKLLLELLEQACEAQAKLNDALARKDVEWAAIYARDVADALQRHVTLKKQK